jgi:hypothetical protein
MLTATEGYRIYASFPSLVLFITGFLKILNRLLIFSLPLFISGVQPIDGGKRPGMLQQPSLYFHRFTTRW